MTQPHSYRADIDGLRALAVVPVVLFHAHLPWVSGGYVGVDVFFVISGFLITSLVAAELERGTFSIATFYERRVRRIFPAFFSVIAASSLAAFFILPPAGLKDFASSVIAASGFASNVLFFEQADYFDAPAHMKPLLHTWSLAVEEQFYIIFPLLLGLLYRRARAFIVPCLVVLALASFVACVWTTTANPVIGRQLGAAAAFYLSPFRGWELLMGSLLALRTLPRWPESAVRLRETSALLGVGLIGGAIFGLSERSAFPGANALFPCVGAGLIIHAGIGGSTLVGSLLSLGPVVFVGKISYSLYLWHWPLLIFAGLWFAEPLQPTQAVVVVVGALLTAACSWRIVEQPFRNHTVAAGRRSLFGFAAVGTAALLTFGVSTWVNQGWPGRMTAQVRSLDDARNDSNPDRKRCHASDKKLIGFDNKCIYGALGRPPSVAIWGDSFAAELAVALGQEAGRRELSLLFISYSACPPALALFEDRPLCEEHNRAMVQALTHSRSISTIVLVARYEAYSKALGEDAFLAAFERAVMALADAGKDVVITYPIPKPPAHVPTLLARLAGRGGDPREAHIERARYEFDNAKALALFDRLTQLEHVRAARVQDVLCTSSSCALMADDDVLFFDENHLSLRGAQRALPAFSAAFPTR